MLSSRLVTSATGSQQWNYHVSEIVYCIYKLLGMSVTIPNDYSLGHHNVVS